MRRRLVLLLLVLAGVGSSIGGVRAATATGTTEVLGVPVSELRVQQGPLSPDPAGTGFVQLLYSFPGPSRVNPDRPFEVLAVNLQTRAVKRVPVSSLQQGMGYEVWGAADGVWSRGNRPQLFFRPNGSGARLMSWNPKTQTVWHSDRLWAPWPKAQLVYSLASSPDNWIIGGGANDSAVVRFNPATGQVVESPPASLPGDYRPAYAQEVGGDIYATYVLTGKQPYRVVARPTKGGPDRILMQFEDPALFDPGDPLLRPRLHQTATSVYAHLALKGGATYTIQEGGKLVTKTVPGPPGARVDLYWWLRAGTEIRPLASPPDLTPPRSPVPANPPEVIVDKNTLAAEGKARVWYRFPKDVRPYPSSLPTGAEPEDYGWKTIDVTVNTSPLKTAQAVAQPDGSLFGSTYHSGAFYRYDPVAGFQTLGPPVLSEVYALLGLNGKTYIGGYSKARIFEYDPARPWTANQSHPFALKDMDAADPRANPREIANFMTDFGALSGNYLANDSAGRIYVGTASSRNSVGGGLGILTPAPNGGWASGNITSPLRNYRPTGLAASSDGRYIALSSQVVTDPANPSATPTEARVFVLDSRTSLSTFRAQWTPVAGTKTLGQLAGVGSTQFIGSASPSGGRTQLYLLDAVSGAVIRRLDYPGEIMSSGNFVTGPDGDVYAAVKAPGGRRIVRISADLTSVATVADVTGDYERFAFVGRDLFLTGSGYYTNDVSSLKRIPGVVP